MDFLVALIIISPALVFLWLALIRYHARTDQETKQEEQIYIPPSLPKIMVPRNIEPQIEEQPKETIPDTVIVPEDKVEVEENTKPKNTKRATKSKSEKTSTKPKQTKIKRTK